MSSIFPVMLIATATTSAIAAAAMVLRDALMRRERAIGRRLGATRQLPPPDVMARELKTSPYRMDRAFVELMESSGVEIDVATMLLIILCGALVGGGFPLVLYDHLIGTAVGMVAGAAAPLAWLTVKRARRLSAMQKQLPEALELVADFVRNGHGIERSAQAVVESLSGPLAEEFRRCTHQLQLGHAPVQALEGLARRVPLPEMRVFATAVVVHQRTGGNLARLAERLAAAGLDRQESLNHLNAVTSGSRLSAIGLCVGCAAGVAILTWIQPEYMRRLIEHPTGPTLIMISAALLLAGALWIWRILRVNY